MCKSGGKQVLDGYRDYIAQEEKWMEKLRKAHNDNPYTVEDQLVADSQVCLIFSCPGREELIANKVCSGTTGKTLNSLLCILNKQYKEIFNDTDKSKYSIANASNIVHFEALGNKSEGNKNEITNEKNINRIKDFLGNIKALKYVILFGDTAHYLTNTVEEINPNCTVIKSKHLSMRRLNSAINEDLTGKNIEDLPEEERTHARLAVVANEIINQIKKVK